VRVTPKWALILALGVAAAAAQPASAADFCVSPENSCSPANTFTDIQPALDGASNTVGSDRVLIGAGSFLAPSGGLLYDGIQPGTVEIRGAGRDATTINEQPTIGSESTLRLAHTGPGRSTVTGLTLTVASGPSNFGLWLISNTDARDVAVRAQDGVANARGVDLRGTSMLSRSLVDVGTGSPGIEGGVAPADDTRVEDSTVIGRKGVLVEGGHGTVVRTKVVATDTALGANDSTLRADNVVVDMNHAGGGSVALSAFGSGGVPDALIDARNVTILGDSPGVNGASAFATGNEAIVNLVNSIVRVRGGALLRNAGSGAGDKAATINASNNDYRADGVSNFSNGNGTLTNTSPRTDDPRFLGDPQLGDVRLRFDSPLIDAGIAGTDEPADDYNADPRIVDGDGNGSAVRDIGAVEYQRRPPVVTAAAAPASALTGAPFDWSATASDPDGDPVALAWSWDDGGSAPGATASHAFASPGHHTGTATATDGSGATTTASAAVDVTSPAARPPVVADTVAPLFTIVRRGLRMSRKRDIAVRVDCAASELEPCAGTVALASTKRVAPRRRILKLGTARFKVAAGRTGLIRVRASRSAARIAKRLKKVKVTATGVATDAAGNRRTVKRSLTLVIARTRR
jgi:hypothetical protein